MSGAFYDSLADYYHLIFQDWEAAVHRQGAMLAKQLLPPATAGTILDVACGIGTQALGLAALGYAVEGSDLSATMVERARRETARRGMTIPWRVDDMRTLASAQAGGYGAVICMDNALPHLDSDTDIAAALTAMRGCLRKGGALIISLRDYSRLLPERPASMPPAVHDDHGHRRIVHQVWDWLDDRRYVLHLYITRQTRQTPQGWRTHHFVGRYRAVTPHEVAALADAAGFHSVRIIPPEESEFYQPMVIGVR